ncbi:MAG: glycosyltransferase family 2 protein [Alphaproteobacteria bacterium]|nr:glycosyltransferase family 2 protein [Alphaproteobacteria bacterium]
MPRITACICTYDRYDLLPKAIASLERQSLAPAAFRILVVDNTPDEARAREEARRHAAIPNLVYRWEKTPGLSNARNVGTQECGTEFIAFMDDDALASPRWLAEILEGFDRFGAEVMIVGGKVVPMWEVPRPSWLHDGLLGHVSAIDWGGGARIAADNEWFAGTNISFRVSALKRHGGFSRSLGRIGSGAALLSNEEIELIEAIRAAGGKLVYMPDAMVEHLVEKRRLTRQWFRKRLAWQAASDFILSPEKAIAKSKTYWPAILDYYQALPPEQRSVRGLFFDTEDPNLFNWQLGVVYMMTTLHLSGFEGAG